MIDRRDFDFENTPVSKSRPTVYHQALNAPGNTVVTIVTPYFNTGKIFEETARSVFRQTFQSWEWIIVDDGSTDPAALRILEAHRHSDPRVRVINHPVNRGLSAARNTGVNAAQGEYIVLLDSDDLLEPTFVEKCLWHLFTHLDVAFTKGYSIGFGAERYIWVNGFHSGPKFLEQNQVDPTSMIRRSVFLQVGGNDESIRGGLEDWDFWLRAADNGYWGDTISEPLNWYRRREGHWSRWQNISSGKKRRQIIAGFQKRYGKLWKGGFPAAKIPVYKPDEALQFDCAFQNPLAKPRRRLLLILPHLEMGGADRFNLDLIAQLIRRFDWDVSIVTTRRSDDPWSGAFAALTTDVFMLHRFMHLSDYPRFLHYFIGSRQPDLVLLSHSLLGYRLLPWLKAAFPSLPIVDLVHIAMEEWMAGGYPRFSTDQHAFLQSTVATSDFLRKWMITRGHNASKIEVCYTNVDPKIWIKKPEAIASMRRRWKIKDDRPVLLYAARFCDQKQPRLLPGIVAALIGRGVDFLLVLAGDGPDREWLRINLCRRYPKFTRMLGAVGPDDMLPLMAGSDILLLPSQNEGIALVLFEALSMGVVPVATNVGGQSELVTPDCGLLLENGPNLIEETADAVATLLADPARRRDMARRGREKVEALHTLDRMGDQMQHVFLRTLAAVFAPVVPGPAEITSARKQAAEAVRQSLLEQTADDLWDEKMKQGDYFPRIISFAAQCARSLPLVGPLFRRFEHRYGTQLGRMIMRWS